MYSTIYKFVIFLLCEIILYISINFFYTTFLGRFIHRKRSYIIFAIYIILNITKYFLQSNTGFIWLLASLSLETLIGYCYSKKTIRIFLFALLNCFLNTVSEELVGLSLSLLYHISITDLVTNGMTYTIGIFLSRFLFMLTTYILFMYKTKHDITKIISNFWPVIAIFTIGSIYILYALCYFYLNTPSVSYPKIILILYILTIFNLTVYYLFNRQCHDSVLKDEVNRLNKYINIQNTLSKETLNNAERISTMKHDLKNLFLGLYGLMNKKNYSEVERIVKEQAEYFSVPEQILHTGDTVLDTIVNYKNLYAKNHDIHCEIVINISSSININSDDLSIILGNSMDNAIEYLMTHDIEDKTLYLNIKYSFDVLTIIVSNPVIENISIPDDYHIVSTKSDCSHGYGIKSMKKITEKYNGVFEIRSENNTFTTTMNLICNNVL